MFGQLLGTLQRFKTEAKKDVSKVGSRLLDELTIYHTASFLANRIKR